MADLRCRETQGGQDKTTVQTENMDASDSESDTEDIYEVEKIVDMSKSKGKTLYRVRWAGYGPSWDTWEPADNLETCHHVIDQYMDQLRAAKAKAEVEVKDGKDMKEADSDTDSVHSSASRASRKRKSTKGNYVYVEDEDCDTLKDKFWRDLEEGKINVFGNDMYSKVKGQGRSARPTSFSDMFKNHVLEQQRRENGEEDMEVCVEKPVSEPKPVEKRVLRDSKSSSTSASQCADAPAPDEACSMGLRRTKRPRMVRLVKQISNDSDSSSSVVNSPCSTRSDSPNPTAMKSVEKWAAKSSKAKTDNRVKEADSEQRKTSERLNATKSGEVAESSAKSETRIKSKLRTQSDTHMKSDAHTKAESRVKLESHSQEASGNIREDSPRRERAPIMVIRRSADGNGYTQKLVDSRSRTKSSTSSSEEKSPPPKSKEKKISPFPASRELVSIKTEVTSPVSIKITTVPKRSSADDEMDVTSSKLRSSRIMVTPPASSEMLPSEKSKLGIQMACLSLQDIREEWAKRDSKLRSCHVSLIDVLKHKESVVQHTKPKEHNNNVNNSLHNEASQAVHTVYTVTGGSLDCKETTSLKPEPSTSLSGAGVSNDSALDEKPRIPKMKISTSPPTCRCVTSTSSMSASLSSLTTYRIHSSLTSTRNTFNKSETNTTSHSCSTTSTRTSAPQPHSAQSSTTICPTTMTGENLTSSRLCHAKSPRLSPEHHTTPQTTASAQPLGDSTGTPLSQPSKFRTMESFISELRQQGKEEIPGLGDILPLSLRPTLQPSGTIKTRTPPSHNIPTAACAGGSDCGQPMGNALPPISTLPGASPPSVQTTNHNKSPLSQKSLQTSPLSQSSLQTSPLAPCGLLPQSLTHTQQQQQQQYSGGHHNVHPDLSGLSSLLSNVGGPSPPNQQQQQLNESYPDLSVVGQLSSGVINDTVHCRPPYPVPSPTQYSTSSMLSPFPDPTVISPAPHLEPMSPISSYLQPSPLHLSMESPRYPTEEPCNQFNDVDMRRVCNPNAQNPVQAQHMSRSAGTPSCTPNAVPPRSGYNPYSPHQGTSPYATSTGSPAAWSMSSPSPGTPGGSINMLQGQGTAGNLLPDDTTFDFDLLDVDPSLWDHKQLSDKKTDRGDVTNLELKNAVRNNDYETVRRALGGRTRYDLELKDEMGVTLLMMAAARSYDDVLELLVLNSANINARSRNGSTALTFACENGHRCTVELLLIMGAHMNVQTAAGDTALTKAIKNGNKHIVRLLLDHGANFSSPSYLTAMKVAKQRNQPEITEILNKHISWVTADFENQVNITLNNTAGIMCALFPMQCFALSESDNITINFNHELQPTLPGVGVLLFIAHARITSSEVKCRFYGPCAVNSATLNGYQLHPLTEEANFVMSFSPLLNGRNDLEIKTVKAPTSRAKLVVCAYKAQLALPPD